MKIRKVIYGVILAAGLFWAGPMLEDAAAYSLETAVVGVGELPGKVSGGEENKKAVPEDSQSVWENSAENRPGALGNEGQENTWDESWKLILVNRWNPIPEDYEITFTELQNDHRVDSRIYLELQQMFDDARAQGILPMISSSYRTAEMQQELMEEQVAEYQAEGYGYEEAKELAEQWVAVPGTSEHQIGIAVDITTADWQQQDASIVWNWLNENSYKYGFILRYPEDKAHITGVMAEPWHYRYVGKEAAQEIYEMGVCLEEYLLP